MLRLIVLFASIIAAAMPVAAQAPEGWMVRIDKSENANDPDDRPDVKFAPMGKGFHITGGPAGSYWNPKNTVAGDFTASATFTLMKPSGHTNYYGLIFGGGDLGAATQNYIYFLVAQDGTYTLRHRSGNEVHDIQARVKHDAVQRPGSSGQSVNTVEVRVAGNTISYVINGTVVTTTPKSGMTAKTDGIVGIRVNHQLDVHVENFTVTKK
jgi:hypothetical protein